MNKLYYVQIKENWVSETKTIFNGSDGYRTDSFSFSEIKQNGYQVTVDEIMFSFDEEDMRFRKAFAEMQSAMGEFSCLRCMPKVEFPDTISKIITTSNSPTKRVVDKVVEDTNEFVEDCFFVFKSEGMTTNFVTSQGKTAILNAPINPEKGKILGHKAELIYNTDEILEEFHLVAFFSVMD